MNTVWQSDPRRRAVICTAIAGASVLPLFTLWPPDGAPPRAWMAAAIAAALVPYAFVIIRLARAADTFTVTFAASWASTVFLGVTIVMLLPLCWFTPIIMCVIGLAPRAVVPIMLIIATHWLQRRATRALLGKERRSDATAIAVAYAIVLCLGAWGSSANLERRRYAEADRRLGIQEEREKYVQYMPRAKLQWARQLWPYAGSGGRVSMITTDSSILVQTHAMAAEVRPSGAIIWAVDASNIRWTDAGSRADSMLQQHGNALQKASRDANGNIHWCDVTDKTIWHQAGLIFARNKNGEVVDSVAAPPGRGPGPLCRGGKIYAVGEPYIIEMNEALEDRRLMAELGPNDDLLGVTADENQVYVLVNGYPDGVRLWAFERAPAKPE